MKRVPPSERTKAELAALFTAGTTGDPQTELVRLAVRQIVEEALEATARDVLQRDYQARSPASAVPAGERAVMKLMFAALIRASENWRGIRISQFERHQLERLQEQLKKGFQERQEPVIKESSTPIPIYSSERT